MTNKPIPLNLSSNFRTAAAILAFALATAAAGFGQDRAAWMREARWGVMTHFLADWISPDTPMTVERWNKLIDGFDVEGLARQLESAGAGYYLITLGQNSGFYLSPNETYDRFVGVRPSKCSRRDLVADLHEALSKRGIKLMVYLPSGAPDRDETAMKMLGWRKGPYRNREFQLKWEQVIREWSQRWGDKLAGWWFDGCYWPNSMYRFSEAPNFASLAAAARAGNPDSALAFNPGIFNRQFSLTSQDDYIAGEISEPERIDIRRAENGKVDGRQVHMLSYLGERWGQGSPRFTAEQAISFTKTLLDEGGVVTWDTPIQTNGVFAKEFVEQLSAINKAFSKK